MARSVKPALKKKKPAAVRPPAARPLEAEPIPEATVVRTGKRLSPLPAAKARALATAKKLGAPALEKRLRTEHPAKRGPKTDAAGPVRDKPFTIHTAHTGRLSKRLRTALTVYPHLHPTLEGFIYSVYDETQAMHVKGIKVDFATLFVDRLERALKAGWHPVDDAPVIDFTEAAPAPAVIAGALDMGDEI